MCASEACLSPNYFGDLNFRTCVVGIKPLIVLEFLQIGDKVVYHFTCDVLHHYHMRQIAAEALVMTVCEIVLGYNLICRTPEKHSIACNRCSSSPSRYAGVLPTDILYYPLYCEPALSIRQCRLFS